MKRTLLSFALIFAAGMPLMAEGGDSDRPHRDRPERPSFEEMVKKMAARIMEAHPDMTREEALRIASEKVKAHMSKAKDRGDDKHRHEAIRKKVKHLAKRIYEELIENYDGELTEEVKARFKKEAIAKAKAKAKAHHEQHQEDGTHHHAAIEAKIRRFIANLKEKNPDITEEEIREAVQAFKKRLMKDHRRDGNREGGENDRRRDRDHGHDHGDEGSSD